ncbi:MAG: hypothetical protein D4R67_01585 [Bacteroidetes bacterium]|nr:MAG: hypothetical protein D4R67_01585 [Bacteroidota bacterium]
MFLTNANYFEILMGYPRDLYPDYHYGDWTPEPKADHCRLVVQGFTDHSAADVDKSCFLDYSVFMNSK